MTDSESRWFCVFLFVCTELRREKFLRHGPVNAGPALRPAPQGLRLPAGQAGAHPLPPEGAVRLVGARRAERAGREAVHSGRRVAGDGGDLPRARRRGRQLPPRLRLQGGEPHAQLRPGGKRGVLQLTGRRGVLHQSQFDF